MASTSDFKNGLCIKFNNDLVKIIEFQHVKPGKGPAFVRSKLRSLTTGRVIDNTFTSGHKVEIIRIENRPHQFLYKDDTGYHFMNNETFDQIVLQKELISAPQFLKDGDSTDIMFHADEELPLSCELSQYVILEVTYTEPGLKGDTASSSASKPATVETGAIVNVPLFISIGEKIRIESSTGTYMERVKE